MRRIITIIYVGILFIGLVKLILSKMPGIFAYFILFIYAMVIS